MPQGDTIDILDDGHPVRLDYAGALRFHGGSSIWGVAAAFRAMQAAARYFSAQEIWDRRSLRITSAHPGPGVRDAVEYVTHCVSQGRYRLTDPQHEGRCGAGMQFHWWIDDGQCTVAVMLRDGFVPDEFFELVDRADTEREQPADRDTLRQLKHRLIEQLWAEPLERLFHVTLHDRGRATAQPSMPA